MTISIWLGNVGAGKTACAVRHMAMTNMHFYSNIITKGLKNNTSMSKEMIMKDTEYTDKITGKPKAKLLVNKEFWEEQVKKYQPISVIVDEAHALINARRGMSKKSLAFMDWLAMIRRVLGSVDNVGSLILISQLERRIDVIAKEMCNEVRYFICHYTKTCQVCGCYWSENNESCEIRFECPRCTSDGIKKTNILIECWHFQSMDNFVRWKYLGIKRQYYRHYYIKNITDYFPMYNTLQWENLLSDE